MNFLSDTGFTQTWKGERNDHNEGTFLKVVQPLYREHKSYTEECLVNLGDSTIRLKPFGSPKTKADK